MPFEFTAYTLLYVVTLGLSVVAAVKAFPNRMTAGGRWLFLMAVSIVVWCAAEVLDFSSTDLQWHVFAAQISYLGGTTAPVFFFLFAVEYSARWRRVSYLTAATLMIVPVATIALALTNRFHSLVWTSFTQHRGLASVILYGHGAAYWAITVYSLILGAAAILLIADTAVRSRGIFRTRSLIVVIAALAPWVMQLLYSLSPASLVGLDPSLALSITCLLVVTAISRFRLLDLVPIPREVLVEEMIDGMVVLDPAMQVLELNPAAVRLLGLEEMPSAGVGVAEVFASWGAAAELAVSAFKSGSPAVISTPDERRIAVNKCSVGVSLSTGSRELVILRDVTAQVLAEQALQLANGALRQRVDEIELLQAQLVEQANRDSLTGLSNRRYLDEELPRELARAKRGGYPLSVVMFDVDLFKQINDDGGHAAGDVVLIELANMLTSTTRESDIVCRYGGDEFVVVMPHTEPISAVSRAEGWQSLLRRSVFAGAPSGLTISVGVAVLPLHGETASELMVAADQAVYASKSAGRNRVRIASGVSMDLSGV